MNVYAFLLFGSIWTLQVIQIITSDYTYRCQCKDSCSNNEINMSISCGQYVWCCNKTNITTHRNDSAMQTSDFDDNVNATKHGNDSQVATSGSDDIVKFHGNTPLIDKEYNQTDLSQLGSSSSDDIVRSKTLVVETNSTDFRNETLLKTEENRINNTYSIIKGYNKKGHSTKAIEIEPIIKLHENIEHETNRTEDTVKDIAKRGHSLFEEIGTKNTIKDIEKRGHNLSAEIGTTNTIKAIEKRGHNISVEIGTTNTRTVSLKDIEKRGHNLSAEIGTTNTKSDVQKKIPHVAKLVNTSYDILLSNIATTGKDTGFLIKNKRKPNNQEISTELKIDFKDGRYKKYESRVTYNSDLFEHRDYDIYLAEGNSPNVKRQRIYSDFRKSNRYGNSRIPYTVNTYKNKGFYRNFEDNPAEVTIWNHIKDKIRHSNEIAYRDAFGGTPSQNYKDENKKKSYNYNIYGYKNTNPLNNFFDDDKQNKRIRFIIKSGPKSYTRQSKTNVHILEHFKHMLIPQYNTDSIRWDMNHNTHYLDDDLKHVHNVEVEIPHSPLTDISGWQNRRQIKDLHFWP